MNTRSIVPVLALAVAACSAQGRSSDADTAWVGTITTDGNVTTVVNEVGGYSGNQAGLLPDGSGPRRSRVDSQHRRHAARRRVRSAGARELLLARRHRRRPVRRRRSLPRKRRYPPAFGLDERTFISGEVVVDATVDAAGTIVVKRYRLVLPGER
jgi:hypothetical protein